MAIIGASFTVIHVPKRGLSLTYQLTCRSLVLVGQLRPRKGIDLLLEAFVEHCQQGGAGHLLLAGAAPVPDYEQNLREIATNVGPPSIG